MIHQQRHVIQTMVPCVLLLKIIIILKNTERKLQIYFIMTQNVYITEL